MLRAACQSWIWLANDLLKQLLPLRRGWGERLGVQVSDEVCYNTRIHSTNS
jgi:hypothetical protein